MIVIGYVGYALAQVALSVIESGMDIEESVWMKEVEDGCVVEMDEMCFHGAAYPMLEWEEVDGEPIEAPFERYMTIEKGSR
jgi:hypothetical protein